MRIRRRPELHLQPDPNTPSCPNCGAKFAHSNTEMRCLKCGITDETVLRGKSAIRSWAKGQARLLRYSALAESEQSKASAHKCKRPSGSNRRTRPHGRSKPCPSYIPYAKAAPVRQYHAKSRRQRD